MQNKYSVIINFKNNNKEEIDPCLDLSISGHYIKINNGYCIYDFLIPEIKNIEFKQII